jgi:hypothetical protein
MRGTRYYLRRRASLPDFYNSECTRGWCNKGDVIRALLRGTCGAVRPWRRPTCRATVRRRHDTRR